MTPRRFMPALLLLFVGSGCAALIYEVVWFQLLQLVIGSSAVSLAVLLGTFMGGMCLGSFLLPRYISAREHPLRVYAFIELGIGVFGLFILFGMPALANIYTAWGGSGPVGLVFRGVAASFFLLPPTILMGATLPAMSRWVESTPDRRVVARLLLRRQHRRRRHRQPARRLLPAARARHGVATYVAVALNVAVGALALLVASAAPNTRRRWLRRDKAKAASGAWAVYAAIALSGMTALASQVIWTRLLSLLFGATVYTFSLILAVFLFGLGIGSSVGSMLARSLERPRLALRLVQMLLCGAIAWAAYMLAQSMPYWPINPSISTSPWFNFPLDLARAFWVVLPGVDPLGRELPAGAGIGRRASGQDPGAPRRRRLRREHGRRDRRRHRRQPAAGRLARQPAFAAGADHPLRAGGAARSRPAAGRAPTRRARARHGPARCRSSSALSSPALLARNVPPIPKLLVAYGRYAATRAGQDIDVIYMGEGWNASVAVTRLPGGVLNYHNAGKVQASSEPQDMRLQRMLGHLTTLIPKSPKKVLVIGCGAGVTAGAVSIDPDRRARDDRRDRAARAEGRLDLLRRAQLQRRRPTRRCTCSIDDARHYLLTTNEKFDAITSDPLDPWVKGAAMLYTREFFELVKSHLNPGGVVTLFVQLYESNTAAVKSEIATFMEAFPNGVVWGNTQQRRAATTSC